MARHTQRMMSQRVCSIMDRRIRIEVNGPDGKRNKSDEEKDLQNRRQDHFGQTSACRIRDSKAVHLSPHFSSSDAILPA